MSSTDRTELSVTDHPATFDRDATRQAALRDEVRTLREELAERERELEATREWVDFVEDSVRSYRDRAEELEERVEHLEAELEAERDDDGDDLPDSVLGRVRFVLFGAE